MSSKKVKSMQIEKFNYNQILKKQALSFGSETVNANPITLSDVTKKDKFVKTDLKTVQKPKSGLLKKIAVGCLSLTPGLGQFVNGQWLKAATFAIGVPIAVMAGFFVGGYLGLGLMAGAYLWNIVDAVKNA